MLLISEGGFMNIVHDERNSRDSLLGLLKKFFWLKTKENTIVILLKTKMHLVVVSKIRQYKKHT